MGWKWESKTADSEKVYTLKLITVTLKNIIHMFNDLTKMAVEWIDDIIKEAMKFITNN